MLENGFKRNTLCCQWSTISSFNCHDQTAKPGRSDPVYTDSAKKPDLAKGCFEKMLFLHAVSIFSHAAPNMLKPVGKSDNANCYLII